MPNRQPPAPPARAVDTKKAVIGGTLAGGAMVAALAMAVTGIKPDEGKVNATYLDVARIPTYCYGHADRSSKVGAPHTDAQCEAILTVDVQRELVGVATCVPALRDRPYQWAASTRMAHNTGVYAFCRSSTARAFNAGRWRAGCDAMLLWDKVKVNGRKVQVAGLSARRQRERAQCLTELPA